MNKKELKAVMARYGDRYEDLAAFLGIALSSLSNKINGIVSFRQTEISQIVIRYKLSPEDIQKIFFADTVN